MDGDKVTMDVTLFVKQENGSFLRFDETHTQYVYTEAEIETALKENGFELLQAEGHLGGEKALSDRICFLAKRVE
jgi:hypothetical protein